MRGVVGGVIKKFWAASITVRSVSVSYTKEGKKDKISLWDQRVIACCVCIKEKPLNFKHCVAINSICQKFSTDLPTWVTELLSTALSCSSYTVVCYIGCVMVCYCPARLWILPPWRHSRLGWMGLWATWYRTGCPGHCRGVGIRCS